MEILAKLPDAADFKLRILLAALEGRLDPTVPVILLVALEGRLDPAVLVILRSRRQVTSPSPPPPAAVRLVCIA